MLRLSRSKAISEIEFIVDRPIAGIGPLRWEKNGAECTAERYGYRGEFYSFDVEIMRVRSLGKEVGAPYRYRALAQRRRRAHARAQVAQTHEWQYVRCQ